MNKIETFRDELWKRFPGSTAHLAAPVVPTGTWTLDVTHNGRWIVIDWTPPDRYGVSVPNDDTAYGEGPDELFSDEQKALERICALLSAAA